MDCIQAVHTTLAQCGWIISSSLPLVFCGTVPCVYCVHFCRAFPLACCGFRSEIIVLRSVWPLNNIASSTGPQIQPMSYIPYIYLYSGTSLIRASCHPLSLMSSTELHFVNIPTSHPLSYILSTYPHLIHWATFRQLTYISSSEHHFVNLPTSHPLNFVAFTERSHPHRATSRLLSFLSVELLMKYWATCYPPSYISSADFHLIRWCTSHSCDLHLVHKNNHLKKMVSLGYNTCVQGVKFGSIFLENLQNGAVVLKKICLMDRSDIGLGMIYKFVSGSTTRLQVKVGLCIMFFLSKLDGLSNLFVMSPSHMIF